MSKLVLGCYVVGMVQTNFFYMHREGNNDTIVFDPGDYGKELYEELQKQGLTIKAIFLTHGHFDHILGVPAMKKLSGAPVYASELERDFLMDPDLNHSGLNGRTLSIEADHYLRDNEEVTVADITLKMLSTPGHTEGSCCYYIDDGDEGRYLISGDTLFQESVGRTDMPTGSMHDLVSSIRNKLYVLPDDTQVFTGHGGFTTIGYEKQHNYFVHG